MMQNLQREAWYLGNLAGVPIFLHWSAFVMVLLVWSGSSGGGTEGFLLVLIALILGIVLHELGHALAARAFGAHGITITLWALGGLCSSHRDSTRIGREMVIVAAGPAVSLALWQGSLWALELLSNTVGGSAQTSHGMRLLVLGLVYSALVNKSLFFFNMLPIFPMDGGQLTFYAALATTRSLTLARQLSLFLAVFGSLAFFCWRTKLFEAMADGSGVGAWMNSLQFGDLFLAFMLGMMVRSAFLILR